MDMRATKIRKNVKKWLEKTKKRYEMYSKSVKSMANDSENAEKTLKNGFYLTETVLKSKRKASNFPLKK